MTFKTNVDTTDIHINYADMEWTDCTATSEIPPTQKECLREILYYSNELANRKWWQSSKYLKYRLKYYLYHFHNQKED